MKPDDPDRLKRRLHAWNPPLRPDPNLRKHVMQRIGWEAEADQTGWFRRRPGWPLALAGSLAATVLIFLGSVSGYFWYGQQNQATELAQRQTTYRALIDPVFRVESYSAEGSPNPATDTPNLVTMLAWMQDRLALDQGQFLQLVALHGEYESEFQPLYLELVKIQRAYDGFEARRTADLAIDFIALFDLLERRKSLEVDAHDTSAALVQRVLQILNPEQDRRYLAVLESISDHRDA